MVNSALIVFLVILGSAFVTAMGYAVHRTFGITEEQKKRLDANDEQARYMREVRERHFNWLRSYCMSLGNRRPPPVRGLPLQSYVSVADWVSNWIFSLVDEG